VVGYLRGMGGGEIQGSLTGRFWNASTSGHNARQAARHGFGNGKAKGLVPVGGSHKNVGFLIHGGDFVALCEGQEFDEFPEWCGQFPQGTFVRGERVCRVEIAGTYQAHPEGGDVSAPPALVEEGRRLE